MDLKPIKGTFKISKDYFNVPKRLKLNTMTPNAQVTVTSQTQLANKLLGTDDKTLYYMIVETTTGKHIINIGKKTHDTLQELTKGGKK